MRIGFTGSRDGFTSKQHNAFKKLLAKLGATELHHGDCVGADAQAHAVAYSLDLDIFIHPPTDGRKRANCGDGAKQTPYLGTVKWFKPYPYLERNRHIVLATEALIATPKEAEEQLRSGTWSTVRFARKRRRPVYIILPSGKVVEERTRK